MYLLKKKNNRWIEKGKYSIVSCKLKNTTKFVEMKMRSDLFHENILSLN